MYILDRSILHLRPWRAANLLLSSCRGGPPLVKSLPRELSGVLLSLGWLVAVAVGDATSFYHILYCFYISVFFVRVLTAIVRPKYRTSQFNSIQFLIQFIH